MSDTVHARYAAVSRRKPCKGAHESHASHKRAWNATVRASARRYCRDFYRLNVILYSGYPEYENVPEPVPVKVRPYID